MDSRLFEFEFEDKPLDIQLVTRGMNALPTGLKNEHRTRRSDGERSYQWKSAEWENRLLHFSDMPLSRLRFLAEASDQRPGEEWEQALKQLILVLAF